MSVLWCLFRYKWRHYFSDGYGRTYITRYPVEDESSSYINAIQVDGFRNLHKFIVTQQPLPNTVGDFWRLVAETDAAVIVSLHEIDETDEVWPYEMRQQYQSETNEMTFRVLAYFGPTVKRQTWNLFLSFPLSTASFHLIKHTIRQKSRWLYTVVMR